MTKKTNFLFIEIYNIKIQDYLSVIRMLVFNKRCIGENYTQSIKSFNQFV
jgi:hypothetical protein